MMGRWGDGETRGHGDGVILDPLNPKLNEPAPSRDGDIKFQITNPKFQINPNAQ
jgi:hypothetical protein